MECNLLRAAVPSPHQIQIIMKTIVHSILALAAMAARAPAPAPGRRFSRRK